MIGIGRYKIYFTSRFWIQTHNETQGKKILFMTVFREARPSDVDKVKQSELGPPLDNEGRVFRCYRAKSDTPPGQEEYPLGRPEVDKLSDIILYPLGTCFRNEGGDFQYGRAGTHHLKCRRSVYSKVLQKDVHFDGAGSLLKTGRIRDLLWGNLSPAGPKIAKLGVAVVNVPPFKYCWIRI